MYIYIYMCVCVLYKYIKVRIHILYWFMYPFTPGEPPYINKSIFMDIDLSIPFTSGWPSIILPHMHVGLYTILLLPILYGVWHTSGRSRGGRILHDSRATVLQHCEQCRWAGEMKGGLIRVETTRSNKISCKGQFACMSQTGLRADFVGWTRSIHYNY